MSFLKTISTFVLTLGTLFLLVGAPVALAQPGGTSMFESGIVPCGTNVPGTNHPCTFADLVRLVQNITQFLLYLAVFVATVLFAYAGFLYMFAAGNPGEISKAHRIFFDAGIGLVFMASAWLIVKLIVSVLDSDAGKQFLGN